MFTNTPSDRVQVVPLGRLQPPAACALCGSGNDQMGYIHTDVWYEYEGYVYFCLSNCARQLAEVFGCLLPEEAEILKAQATEIAETNKTLEAELNEARSRLSTFDSIIADGLASGALSVPSVPESVSIDEGSEADAKRPSRRTSTRESKTKESAAKQGPNDGSRSTGSIVL